MDKAAVADTPRRAVGCEALVGETRRRTRAHTHTAEMMRGLAARRGRCEMQGGELPPLTHTLTRSADGQAGAAAMAPAAVSQMAEAASAQEAVAAVFPTTAHRDRQSTEMSELCGVVTKLEQLLRQRGCTQ